MRPISQGRRGDAGFALLLVALMAAVAALMLYRELPRVAFQSQRQKEQMLVERGEEYKRAIQLFQRANSNRWPASIEELESFNNKRFLRHRYKDPMTGKDEWRLIHISNGVLTDSVNSKPPSTQQASNGTGIVAEVPLMPQANGNAQAGVNPALRRRPSDGGTQQQVGPDGQPINGGLTASGLPGAPGMPGTPGPQGIPGMGAFPGGITPTASNGTGTPGAPNGGVPNAGVPGLLGIPTVNGPNQAQGANGQNGSQQSSGGLFGSGSSGGIFGSAPTPTPAQQGQPGQNGVPPVPGLPMVPGQSLQPGQSFNPSGFNPGGGQGQVPVTLNPAAQSAAAGMLQQILTTPRPGGLAGVLAAQQQSSGAVGQGIAGVASKYDADSIMLYGDKQNYAEWEFIWDPTKYRPPPNPLTGPVGTAAGNLNSSNASTGGLFAGGSNAGGATGNGVQVPGQAMGSGGGPPTGQAAGGASAFGNSFSLGGSSGAGVTQTAFGGSVPAGGSAPGMGSPGLGQTMAGPQPGSGSSGIPGQPGQAAMPGGSAQFGGGGGPDIRPGRAN